MKGRKLSLVLIVFMLTNIIAGFQAVLPQAAFAEDEQGIQVAGEGLEGTSPASLTWQQSIFGSSTNATDCSITVKGDGSVTVRSQNGKGKISSSADGIAFYYTQLTAGTPFQISADVKVDSYDNTQDQAAFGLMLRKTVGTNGDTSGHKSNFTAIGAYKKKMQAFYRNNESASSPSVNTIELANAAAAGSTYKLKLIAADDNKCIVSCDNKTAVIDITGLFDGGAYNVGAFAARFAQATYSNINVTTAAAVELTALPSKTQYFQGQDLDLTGLVVTATYGDGTTKQLNSSDYVIYGFDNTKVGRQTITVYYGGRSASFDVNVEALVLTGIDLVYTPAKTTYYLDDPFDPFGMVVNAIYSSGAVRQLDSSEYTISGFDSTTPGTKTVTVATITDSAIKTAFDITVRPSVLQSLQITRQPLKTTYYPGETLDLTGLVVCAEYDDSGVMLQSGEYAVDSSGFDTAAPGQKTITISYKGKTVDLVLTVVAKTLVGISVTTLPKTTFYTGESFDSTGIVVSKVYNNGEKDMMAPGEYTIDSSGFKSDAPGIYDISIIPVDSNLSATTYKVTVREPKTYEWKTAVFGQSVSISKNYVTASAIGTVDGTITLTALEGGGKIAGGHDGITYYYTVIDPTKDNFELSADIKVIEFAKPTPDNQEGFGIMARDAVGSLVEGTQPLFASNIAAVGGYRGVTNAFMRTGVTNSAGNEGTAMTATNWGTTRPGSSNTYPNAPYRLTLKKTNTGFVASLNNDPATTSLFYMPDNFDSQNPEMYIGFFAARLATIEVSNVSFKVSDTATDAPREMPPPTPVTPSAVVTSLRDVSKTDYVLKYKPNVNGTITIKQGEAVIASDVPVTANQEFAKETVIAPQSTTRFTIVLTPDATQSLTNYDRLVTNFVVTMKTYDTPDGAIHVSPAGTSGAAGTSADPLDLDTALKYVKEGQTIFMHEGTYNRTAPVIIQMGNDGTAAAGKSLKAYNNETVTLDFGKSAAGFQLGGNYWHIYGINVTRSTNNGILIGGSNNTVERCTVYANANTGLQISRFTPDLTREFWPSNNLVLNCEAYDNRDPSDNNADGFAAKLTCGEGNVFRGCISHNNIDDGWDLYAKVETGAIGSVLIENCIAYDNGRLTDGSVGAGDKNGFKLGGEGIAVTHTIKNSIAFGNGAVGFTSNSNPAARAYNCVAYDNAGGNFVFTTYNYLTPQFVMSNCISIRSSGNIKDSYPVSVASDGNYFWNGTASVNGKGETLPTGYFASLTPTLPYQRDTAGNIIWGDFLKHVSQSGGEQAQTPTQTQTQTSSQAPAPEIKIESGKPSAMLPAPVVDGKGSATVTVSVYLMQALFEKAKADAGGIKTAALAVPEVQGAKAYKSVLPANIFNSANLSQRIEVKTALAIVEMPGNMFGNMDIAGTDIALSVSEVDNKALPSAVQSQIGNRPVIELSVSSNGKNIGYNNPDAPVRVSIPYKPTPEELKDPEHIVVWYIDGSGKAIPVPDGRYDAATGMVTFSTTHFSRYAITSVFKTFDDIDGLGWAKKEIEVLASKGIIGGTAGNTFTPAEKISRADFTVWLVNSLNFSAVFSSNFSDVEKSDGCYTAVGIARKLGIVKGTGNGLFNGSTPITRQEMFVMTARALRLAKKLAPNGTAADLKSFIDRASVASYAADDIASLVKAGLVKGSGGILNPRGNASRAEAAVFLYRVYSKNI